MSIVGNRKKIKKRCKREYPNEKFAWLGGRLYNVTGEKFGEKPIEVAGVQHLPKDKHEALGLSAARPAAKKKEPETVVKTKESSTSSDEGWGWNWSLRR